MQQVKIFKSIESELWSLQDEINDWIRDNNVKIIQITGNIAPQSDTSSAGGMGSFSASDVLVIVLYEKLD